MSVFCFIWEGRDGNRDGRSGFITENVHHRHQDQDWHCGLTEQWLTHLEISVQMSITGEMVELTESFILQLKHISNK